MAKKSSIERNDKRRKLAAKYSSRRAHLKEIACDRLLPPEERFAARLKLAKLPRNERRTIWRSLPVRSLSS